MSTARRFEVVRSKLSPKLTCQLIDMLISLDWSANVQTICQDLAIATAEELENRYVWMVGSNPTYFIQYQVPLPMIFSW